MLHKHLPTAHSGNLHFFDISKTFTSNVDNWFCQLYCNGPANEPLRFLSLIYPTCYNYHSYHIPLGYVTLSVITDVLPLSPSAPTSPIFQIPIGGIFLLLLPDCKPSFTLCISTQFNLCQPTICSHTIRKMSTQSTCQLGEQKLSTVTKVLCESLLWPSQKLAELV